MPLSGMGEPETYLSFWQVLLALVSKWWQFFHAWLSPFLSLIVQPKQLMQKT